jgi:heptosyltransferase-2
MKDEPKAILALAPNWLGDAAMCTPALRALHRRWPKARLTVAGRASVCALLAGLPWISQSQVLPAQATLQQMRAAADTCSPGRRGLCVVFPHSFRAALFAWLTRAGTRLGYARGGRTWLLTEAVQPHREGGRIAPIYMAREYLDLLAPLGCKDDNEGLQLAADAAEIARVHRLVEGPGPLITIAPAAAFGPSKCWPAARYAAVADRLTADFGARCLLVTGPGEEATRQAVLDAAKTPLLELPGGPSVARLKAAIALSDLLIGNDSGPRHMAIAFKKPVVCIMGPTSPRYSSGPWEHGQVLRVDVDCGPCQKPICRTDHRCMTQITPDQVVAAAAAWLPPRRR